MTERPAYEVIFTPRAVRELERLPPLDVARLRRPILMLAFDQRPTGSARIVGTDLWRIRAGETRVIYHVDDDHRQVVIARVARRSERTYRGL